MHLCLFAHDSDKRVQVADIVCSWYRPATAIRPIEAGHCVYSRTIRSPGPNANNPRRAKTAVLFTPSERRVAK